MRRLVVVCYRLAGRLSRRSLFRPALLLVFLADRLARLAPVPPVVSMSPPRVDPDVLRVPTLVIWDLNAVARGERVRGAFRGREGRA